MTPTDWRRPAAIGKVQSQDREQYDLQFVSVVHLIRQAGVGLLKNTSILVVLLRFVPRHHCLSSPP